jgi:NAD(P)-dependent dehydrogenase (short-subunit alcohol dehydrogenase family)
MSSHTAGESRPLEGRVAIVTGAAGGIGREQALSLARQGANIVANDHAVSWDGQPSDRDAINRVVQEVTERGGPAVANADDVATLDGAQSVVDLAIDTYGRLDIIVNHAGIVGLRNNVWDLTEQAWDDVLSANLKSAFFMTKCGAPPLCRQGDGVIVNMSSTAGFGSPLGVPYGSANEGVIGLSRSVARELGRFGVRCNAVRPFAFSDRVIEYERPDLNNNEKWLPLVRALVRVGTKKGGDDDDPTSSRGRKDGSGTHRTVTRFSEQEITDFPPSAVANFVSWLCTEAARNVNGRTFFVAGKRISLYAEPTMERDVFMTRHGDPRGLDEATELLTGDLQNEFTFDGYPELQVFE